MKTLEYTVRFNTPAFLGNAEQQGQWRTPPFKALLRQWWRVARGVTRVADLRDEEGRLFGAANDQGGGSRQSQVRIRLKSWASGRLSNPWGNDPQVFHPEVGAGGRDVGSHLYLGYGPLGYEKGRGTVINTKVALQENETNILRLSWPEKDTVIEDALQLIQWFGTLGGRCRNGWGSIELNHLSSGEGLGDQSFAPLDKAHRLLERIARPLTECLQHDWAHALGRSDEDGRLLVWESAQTFADWRQAMQALARAKIGFRTQFPLAVAGPFAPRHLLAYPVTHHAVHAWGNQSRLANQLRFKVARNADGRLVARIFHLPCALPAELAQRLGAQAPNQQQQAAIWQRVHDWLDNTGLSGFKRI